MAVIEPDAVEIRLQGASIGDPTAVCRGNLRWLPQVLRRATKVCRPRVRFAYMDSAMAAAAFGAGCAAVGGLATGLALKLIERRGQFHNAGRLEVVRSRSSERYQAIRAMTIAMAELDHCVEHVAEPRLFEGELDAYTKRGRKIRLEARFAARTEEDFLGPDLFDDVMAATEAVERFFQAASEEQTPEQLDGLQREWVRRAHLVSDPLRALARSLSSE